eukprot:5576556-Amphidinium_carterae.1
MRHVRQRWTIGDTSLSFRSSTSESYPATTTNKQCYHLQVLCNNQHNKKNKADNDKFLPNYPVPCSVARSPEFAQLVSVRVLPVCLIGSIVFLDEVLKRCSLKCQARKHSYKLSCLQKIDILVSRTSFPCECVCDFTVRRARRTCGHWMF